MQKTSIKLQDLKSKSFSKKDLKDVKGAEQTNKGIRSLACAGLANDIFCDY